VLNEDPRDHARAAAVTATSEARVGGANNTEALDGRAANVISGQSRAVAGENGVAPGQGLAGTNRWISTALPAALTLRLASAAPIAQVQLVFDTGMHRKLNFNPVGAPNDALHWSPQPETVRDYVIEGQATPGADWKVLCNVTGNYLRRRIHSLPCSSKPEPGPAPPPPPPAIAEGALVADLCTGSVGQMWSMDGSGVVSTVVDARKYCLGYSKNLSAFGGKGRAVVALPCDRQPAAPTAWSLKYPSPRNGTQGALLQAVGGAPCLTSPTAACDADTASSVTIAGAGDAGFNGVYARDERAQGGVTPMFTKDGTHQLYAYGKMWHLGQMGTSVAYTSTASGLDGPPVPSGWQTEGAGVAPPPRSITCQGAGPAPGRARCSCVHAVPCAACHSDEYFPGTSVELSDCAAGVTHIRWRWLEISGGDSGAAMLMSEGLCLGLPPAPAESVDAAGGSVWSGPAAVRPSNALHPTVDRAPSTPLSSIRVTVSATNGVAFAVVNEVRLYDQLGEQPFPVQPKIGTPSDL
jgi:hypothetical protein